MHRASRRKPVLHALARDPISQATGHPHRASCVSWATSSPRLHHTWPLTFSASPPTAPPQTGSSFHVFSTPSTSVGTHTFPSTLCRKLPGSFAKTQPYVYGDSLHTLLQLTQHPYYTDDLKSSISDGGDFCQELFRSVVCANDASDELHERTSRVSFLTSRADVYAILSAGLLYVGDSSDGHRNVLYQIFESFFPDGGSPMQRDFTLVRRLMSDEERTEAEVKEAERMFTAMAMFVERSVLQHWLLYTPINRHAFGIISGLASVALEVRHHSPLWWCYGGCWIGDD